MACLAAAALSSVVAHPAIPVSLRGLSSISVLSFWEHPVKYGVHNRHINLLQKPYVKICGIATSI